MLMTVPGCRSLPPSSELAAIPSACPASEPPPPVQRSRVGKHPLGIQVAFTLPLTLPLVIGIAAFRPAWFYHAFMIVLGAHHLPFVFMYGMWQFGELCATLVASRVAIAMYLPKPVSLGARLTTALLFVFAFVGRYVARRKEE
jgi:hypothetical protein